MSPFIDVDVVFQNVVVRATNKESWFWKWESFIPPTKVLSINSGY